eukprot:COSAG01_NODE_46025_length_404_cov_0.468852_1_plen_40_part_01
MAAEAAAEATATPPRGGPVGAEAVEPPVAGGPDGAAAGFQ